MMGASDLDVGCFGRPESWPPAEWEGTSVSRRALILSLLSELAAARTPAPGPGRDFVPAAAKLVRELREDKGRWRDGSRFTGDEDYCRLARAEVTRFYAESNLGGRCIDIDRARVQIEVFEWNGASFRIDVVAEQRPGFLPLDTSFTMAQRMWMRRSGEVIRSEPVYRSANLAEGVREAALPATSRGFHPGLAAFREQLDWIDRALRAVGKVAQTAPPPPPPPVRGPGFLGAVLRRLVPAPPPPPAAVEPAVEVGDGLRDLERYGATIVETASAFRICLNSGRSGLDRFGPWVFLRFEIDKSTGGVSLLQLEPSTPPTLV